MYLISNLVGFRCHLQPMPCLLRMLPISSPPQSFRLVISFSSRPPCPFLPVLLRRSSVFVILHDRPHRPRRVVVVANNRRKPSNNSSDSENAAKREQVSKRLEVAARYLRQLGRLGFWTQLVCTVVATVVFAFSFAVNGMPTSKANFYMTAVGITGAFLSVLWSFGYIRLSERLRNTLHDPRKAPARAQVAKNLKLGIMINLLGMGFALLGLEGTVGGLVAKSLTSRMKPYFQGSPAGHSPVLGLDVFFVQASVNAVLSNFLGCVFSLELLRSLTLSKPPPATVIPKTT